MNTPGNQRAIGAVSSAAEWHATLEPPIMSRAVPGRFEAGVSVYSGTSPEMTPPPLSDNVLVLHLGGPTRVRRGHAGRSTVHDVGLGGLTVMPAMEQSRWSTTGPIEFAHLSLSPGMVAQVMAEESNVEPRDVLLVGQVGARIPIVEQAFRSLIDTMTGADCGRLYPESLLVVLLIALLRHQASLTGHVQTGLGSASHAQTYRGGLAGWQLRRVMDYMAENYAEDVALADLIELVGLSRAQFFRAFKQSTGMTPHAALTRLRLEQARNLCSNFDLQIDEISAAVGLGQTRFAALFKQHVGLSPKSYRNSMR